MSGRVSDEATTIRRALNAVWYADEGTCSYLLPQDTRVTALLALGRLAAGVSGGTPPSEPEDERPGDAHKADSPVQASGSLGGDTEADLGGDGGPVAVDTAPELYRVQWDSAHGIDQEKIVSALSGRQAVGKAIPEWDNDVACVTVHLIGAIPGAESAGGTPTGSARLPELHLAERTERAENARDVAEGRVGRLEEALRALLDGNITPATLAAARAALAGGTPPHESQTDSGDGSAVVAEEGRDV